MLFILVFSGCSSNNTSTNPSSQLSDDSNTSNTSETSDQTTEVDFPTKEIKLVVPYSPGGGFDTAARMVGPYMEKYLPNNVSVIVENMPGGGGNIGLGEVYKAKPDGHTIGLVNLPGHFVKQILGEATYDLQKLEYLGNITTTTYLAAASQKSNYTTLEDFQNADNVVAGITSISSTDGLGVVVSADRLGINAKTINHNGSSEAILSAIRGDVDLVQYPIESLMSYIESEDLVPLWVYSNERIPELPDVPTIVELGYEDLLDTVSLYRVLATSPDTPAEVLAILRESFDQAVNDPEYKQQVINSGATWNPGDHTQAQQVAENSLNKLLPYEEMLKESVK